MSIEWWVTISVCGVMIIIVAYTLWYTRWRMRLHKKGILDIRYDGLTAKAGEPITIFDVRRLEKEYNAKHKGEQNARK